MSAENPPVLAAPILAGTQRQARNAISRALRPAGSGDWLLVATLSGCGYVRCAEQTHDLGRGDLLLFQPGAAQDYGHRDEDGRWRNVWIHFRPREDWLRWLAWPSIAPGVMLRNEDGAFDRLSPLFKRIATSVDGTMLGRQLAMNALEQVVLTLAGNQDRIWAGRSGTMDPRLQKALDYIARDPTSRMDLKTLAGVSGTSRSRLTSLFRQQTGQTPQAYVEWSRLVRAAELLQGGRASISEAAEAAGFGNAFYFSTRFRKIYGTAPSHYRDAARRAISEYQTR